jgi:glucose-1-phosphate thymidylyltransferase
MLVDAGIRDIMVVTGGSSAGDFLRLLGNGEEFGLTRINYAYQKGEGGIAEALGLAREFVDDDRMVVALGDNILQKGIRQGVEAFARQEKGSRIFLKSVDHPWEYGIAEVQGQKIVRVIEKPKDPPSDLAVIGVYMYPPNVFEIIDTLEPSGRGELEITDVNNAYIQRGEMEYEIVDGWWMDAGADHEALLRANLMVAREQGVQI